MAVINIVDTLTADFAAGTLTDVEAESNSLVLGRNNATYTWYDVQGLSANESRTYAEFNEFFNTSNSGVTNMGTYDYTQDLFFLSSGTTPTELPANSFSLEIEGTFYLDESTNYTFKLDSDDAAVFYIDGNAVVEFMQDDAMLNKSGHGFADHGICPIRTVALTKGYHTYKARLVQGTGGYGLKVDCEKNVPNSYGNGSLFYHWFDTQDWYDLNGHPSSYADFLNYFDITDNAIVKEGLHADRVFWKNGELIINGQTTDSKPSYLPKEDTGAESYSWQAFGYIYAPEDGVYTFGIDGDDQCVLYINRDILIADVHNGSGHGFTGTYTRNATINLASGWHTFRVRMIEGGGGDGIAVAWQKPSESELQAVPASYFAAYLELDNLTYNRITLKNTGTRLSPTVSLLPVGTVLSGDISWDRTLNGETVSIETSVDGRNTWQVASNGAAIPYISGKKSLDIRQTLSTNNTNFAPTLDSLTINVTGTLGSAIFFGCDF